MRYECHVDLSHLEGALYMTTCATGSGANSTSRTLAISHGLRQCQRMRRGSIRTASLSRSGSTKWLRLLASKKTSCPRIVPSVRRWVFGVCVLGGLLPGSFFMRGHRRCRAARMDTPLLRGRRCIEMGHNHLAAGLRRNICRRGRAIFALVFLVILLILHLGTHISL